MSQNTVEVNMGKPKLDANSVDFDENDNTVIANTLTNLDGIDYKLYSINDSNNNVTSFSVVSMGNPHAVQIVENLANYDVENKGKWLESNPLFKKRVNAGFIQIIDKHNIHIRVYERGAGETMACGTGACAAVVSAITQGLVTSPVNVHTKGGILNITWDKSLNADVIMQGGATSVFEGIISI
jgi:diaminopimelate epimerase